MTDLDQMETWEAATGGTTHVHVRDPRVRDGWKVVKISGRGRKKIQLSVEERLYNQELVQEDKRHHDPFSNGLLVRTSPPPAATEDGFEGGVSDEQLLELINLSSDEVFMDQVRAIESEVVVRRLLGLAESKATNVRYTALQDYVDERYHIGKTSRVVQELFDDDGRYAHADL
jgi:hypothetical protein